MASPTGETGIRQRIYLPVERTLEYDGSIPGLDVRAALLVDGDLALFCVNRSPERDYRAVISLQDFEPAREATAKTITAPGIYNRYDEDEPDAVGVTTDILWQVSRHTIPSPTQCRSSAISSKRGAGQRLSRRAILWGFKSGVRE